MIHGEAPDPLYLHLIQKKSPIMQQVLKQIDQIPITYFKSQITYEATDAVKIVKEIPLTKGKERMLKAAGAGIILAPGIITVGVLATKNSSKSGSESKLPSESVLTPGNTTSSKQSNDAPEHDSETQPNNSKSLDVAKLPRKPEATQVQKGSDFVTKYSSLNTKHAHISKQTTIVYIVVIVATTLLFIATGVFVLKMQQVKPKKEDLFTDMNQYYATDLTKANSTMHTIYPNASLNQPKM